MSYPAYLSSGPQYPPELEPAIAPLSGARVTTSYLPVLEPIVPVRTPVANIRLFSGPRGSTPPLTSFM